jgi:hypothetical protein
MTGFQMFSILNFNIFFQDSLHFHLLKFPLAGGKEE